MSRNRRDKRITDGKLLRKAMRKTQKNVYQIAYAGKAWCKNGYSEFDTSSTRA